MKKSIHPQLNTIKIECISCKKEFEVRTTTNKVTIDVCSNCHPFYLGTTTSLKSAGRVDRFKSRLAKKTTT